MKQVFKKSAVSALLVLSLNACGIQATAIHAFKAISPTLNLPAVAIDQTVPTLLPTAIAVPIDGTYVAGQNLDFTVLFSKPVTVVGTRLNLMIGSTPVSANYLSGTGTAAIVYRYTVQPGDLDTDGIAVSSSLDLTAFTGSIVDNLGHALSGNTLILPSVSGIKIDAVPPTITSIGVPSPNTYTLGAPLDFTVSFSENVIVSQQTRIQITVGSQIQYAQYFSGTGTNQIIYRYLVDGSNIGTTATSLTNNIDLNSGQIKDAAGNNSSLSYPAQSMSGILIDAATPGGVTPREMNSSDFKITWTDNAFNETGYELQTCSGANCNSFSSYTTLGANQNSYTLTGFGSGTPYRVRVRAIDSGTGTFTPWQTSPDITLGVDSQIWTTDSDVRAMARTGNKLYLGGDFNYIGPITGSLAVIDTSTGALPAGFTLPLVKGGQITTIVADPDSGRAGAFYIGGTFTSVGGLVRNHIARILVDGSVDSWNPDINGFVNVIVPDSSGIFVGGRFDSVNGGSAVTRKGLAAFNPSTQAVLPWNPAANFGSFYGLLISGSTVYVAGDSFSSVGGQTRSNLAAVDKTTGLATAWNPGADGSCAGIALYGSAIYTWGYFSNIGGQARAGFAALDTTTGLATPFNPGGGILGATLAGSTLYVTGYFTTLAGQVRNRAAAFDLTSGNLTAWNPNSSHQASVTYIDGANAYVGGDFVQIGGGRHIKLARLSATSGNEDSSFAFETSGTVTSITKIGTHLIVGGSFSSSGGIRRRGLAQVDVLTGVPTSWNPDLGSEHVNSLLTENGKLYVAGSFNAINGITRNKLARYDLQTGLLDTALQSANNYEVRGMVAERNQMYLFGDFTLIGGINRSGLALISLASGALSAWDAKPNGQTNALVVDSVRDTLYLGGDFTSIGSVPRSRIAAVDRSGLPYAWNPGANQPVNGLSTNASTLFVSGSFTQLGSQPRSYLGSFDLVSTSLTSFNPAIGGAIYYQTLIGDNLLVSGNFDSGTYGKIRVAIFSATTGSVTSFSNTFSSGVYAATGNSSIVYLGNSGRNSQDERWTGAFDINSGNVIP